MPKMKLPMKTSDETPDENPLDGLPGAHQVDPAQLDKETIYEWFGLHLNPAKRVEFMCGLMHMCQPLELRFLGSYLEDLARKDYHVFRDFEFRANNQQELGVLTDVLDSVVRAKLLVCLSLLGSDSRECAGVLFRILSHVDPGLFCKNYPLPPFRDPHHHSFRPACQAERTCRGKEQTCGFSTADIPAGPLNQLALLFTMASLHPAFHFHQRETLREKLDKIELVIEEEGRHLALNAKPMELSGQEGDYLASSPLTLGECADSHPPCQNRRSRRRAIKREVHIEGIVLKCISRARMDKEYTFEVKWSDSSSSNVTKTHLELENFLFKLPKDQCTETFEKGLLRLLSQGDYYESREVEESLREKFLAAPPVFRQARKVCSFFNCDSSYSTKLSCCRCNSQLGKNFQGNISDASSQDEESYSQRDKKKHGTKSTSQCPSCAKGPRGDGRRGPHVAELSVPAERRKRSCTLRSTLECEQDTQRRSHPVTKTKNRVLPTDRNASKGFCLTNGNLLPAGLSQNKGLVAVDGSGLDTFGETSSESYSSPSSPQHRGAESLESEDDNNRDTDCHSDDSCKLPGPDVFFGQQTDPSAVGEGTSDPPLAPRDQMMMENTQFSRLSLMHPLPYVLPNGACDSLAVPPPPPGQSLLPDAKLPSGPAAVQMPPMVPVMSGHVETEKRDIIPTFGFQPLVQRFKMSSSQPRSGPDGVAASTCTAAAISVPSSQLPQDAAAVNPNLTAALPAGDTSHSKHAGLTLPSGLPPAYPPAGAPATAGPVSSPGLVQAAVPPAVPTRAPGSAPSPSPALTHSAPHSECLSFGNTSASCGNPLAFQQTHQQQQQQLIGCGTCGCHNNCGGRGGVSGCQAPLFFPNHQMVAAARQVFSVPPPLFQLTSLCINSYLTQGQQPPHQANGGASLPAFYAAAPPPSHPYGPLHSHSHSHADVPAHMLSTQVVAAASYNLQHQITPTAAFFQRVYQQVYPSPVGMLPPAALGGAGVNKKTGSTSCCNCGVSGHYAQDCKQPSIESTQQGRFRLKYASSQLSETLDNAY
nr:zinc finger CCHC domain-containing protein 2-like isoform X2 [Nerophis lumbriciformis]